MPTLVIAEKPSVGRALAKHLGATTSFKGYYLGSGYIVSWAIGHLIELAPPKSYVDDPWRLDALPILPEKFVLTVKPKTKDQFKILQKLIKDCDIIINAADAAREGELIFRRILNMVPHKNKTIKRLWVSSYTKEDLQKAFSNLKDHSDYDGLYHSGKARSEIDWIYGMNATIGYTLSTMSSSVRSLGRVQSPTFVMIGKAYHAHYNFVVEDIFSAEILLEKDGIEFRAVHKEKAKESSRVDTILSLSGDRACVQALDKKKITVKPCNLYELTSLQIDANNKYGLTAQQTLNVAQQLYEKDKLITYPRTESAFLNRSQRGDIKRLLEHLTLDTSFDTSVLTTSLREEPFNDSKVSDHHAIIPTINNEIPELSGNAKLIYDLIVNRTLASFSRDALKATVYVSFICKSQVYEIRETIFLDYGWKALIGGSEQKDTKLPEIVLGEELEIKDKYCKQSKTVAPSLPTEAIILKMMQNCGKEFGQDVDREIRKDGIGTVATRASIIERLVKVDYIERKGKKIIPSKLGLSLFDEISSMRISNVSITGNIEKGLALVAADQMSYQRFMDTIKQRTFPDIFKEVISKKAIPVDGEKLYCGICKDYSISNYKSSYNCDNCNLVMPKVLLKQSISKDNINSIMKGENVFFERFISTKTKKPFEAELYYDFESSKLEFNFPKREQKIMEGYHCPSCQRELTDRKTFYGCSGYSDGCTFSISKKVSGYTLTEDQILVLLSGGVTDVLPMVSKKNKKKFTAKLVISEGKLDFRW